MLVYYRFPGLSHSSTEECLKKLQNISPHVTRVLTETCFYIDMHDGSRLSDKDEEKLCWILSASFDEENLAKSSFLSGTLAQNSCQFTILEIGPRLNFQTSWSTNAVSVCHSIGLEQVKRIEKCLRYLIEVKYEDSAASNLNCNSELKKSFANVLHDQMTQFVYQEPLKTFDVNINPDEFFEVDVMSRGISALEEVNQDLGLAFDQWDLHYYNKVFTEKLKRNPTSVECFDLAQSNSEHSRHWFFKGKMIIDGKEIEKSMMEIIENTALFSNNNSIIRLSDNSSAIKGFNVPAIFPNDTSEASSLKLEDSLRHIVFTAETHNFPTGVAPFPGATTGTGGRIRDVQAAGTGANVVAGTAGYCFGNLNIPGYKLPWESNDWTYPTNFASALEIAVEASNGASDYGNKFGEPVLAGFSRSFGMLLPNMERREWIKPIMFSGGIGSIDERHVMKKPSEIGMSVVKIGGPIYRIGVGGGSASSIQIQGDNSTDLDFGAVQRGDAEMEQKLNRAIRACVEMKENNPICSIHDQGAGGNGNVLKELVEPNGAIIYAKAFKLGDPTISTLELWGAEYQESNALLVKEEHNELLRRICEREKVDVCFVGTITGDGKIVLKENCGSEGKINGSMNGFSPKKKKKRDPVDIELDVVLGKMPRKEFKMKRVKVTLKPLELDATLTVIEALERVLRLPSVASKRYLTNKVDRSVTGLVAQQQCVGPLHTPVADVAVTSLSYHDTVGAATAIGEQPIKMLIDPCAGARMSLGEALTNLVFSQISELKDVKCSANWMWPAKLPGEGAALYDACKAVCDALTKLGVSIDGGKDSLSMAARLGEETVKSPGSLVVSVYAPCPDIKNIVTPDIKHHDGKGALLYVKLDKQYSRLGGSALAQVFMQVGDESPDLDNLEKFSKCFAVTQDLIAKRLIISGHDVSDGGLVTTLLEMAFAGNCGLNISIDSSHLTQCNKDENIALNLLFAEELGFVLEVSENNVNCICEAYVNADVVCEQIGRTTTANDSDVTITITIDDCVVLEEKMTSLRDIWEDTSFQLARYQSNPKCVDVEQKNLSKRKAPPYYLSFIPTETPPRNKSERNPPKVAVIREEGSNGDREMSACLMQTGFEAWDVNMKDICSGQVTLEQFQGVVFVGGFSFADVLGSAKGWAAVSLFNEKCQKEFSAFLKRKDTFSLGVCNGCQLMAILGWVGKDLMADSEYEQGTCFTHNDSECFESRFVTVKIEESVSVMLRGMEGSIMGVWVSHGEGKAQFKNDQVLADILQRNLAPIRYVDDNGKVTMEYPLNPNGSPCGIAALCSDDGRHLALMPHPERCTNLWQWAWMPQEWRSLESSPWLRMFQNAYEWCIKT